MIKLITCVDSDFGIGLEGRMPWPRLKRDMAYFRNKTLNGTVVAGHRTHEEIGDLPNRTNIVFSKDKLFDILEMSKTQDIWVIGGAKTYGEFYNYAKEIHITRIINKKYNCDTFFPRFNPFPNWKCYDVGFYIESDICYYIEYYKKFSIDFYI